MGKDGRELNRLCMVRTFFPRIEIINHRPRKVELDIKGFMLMCSRHLYREIYVLNDTWGFTLVYFFSFIRLNVEFETYHILPNKCACLNKYAPRLFTLTGYISETT